MNNRSCTLYPNMEKITDAGLSHAIQMTSDCLKWGRDHARFQGPHTYNDYVEAMACLILEDQYRWENGGKQAFDAMIQRTFGRPACN